MKNGHDESLANAVLETVRLPLLALDGDLRVVSANDAFLRQFQVGREDTLGRLIYDLGNGQWDIPELRRLLGEILPKESIVSHYRVEHDFEQIGRRIMHLDARRIGRSDAPDLILLAISDNTEREPLQAELEGRMKLADKLIDSVREGLVILEPDLRVHSASGAFYEIFGVNRAETEGQLIYELGNGQWDIPELRQLLEDVLPRQQSFDDYEVTHTFDFGKRAMLLNGRRLDHMELILLAIRDVTESRASTARLKQVARTANVGVFEDDRRAGTIHWSPEMREMLGVSLTDPPPPAGVVPDFVHPEDKSAVEEMFAQVLDPRCDGTIQHEHRIVRPNGEVRWVQMTGQVDFAQVDGERQPVLIHGVVLDITERKQAEITSHRAYALLEGIAGGAQDLIAALDNDFRLLYANAAYFREYRELWGHDLRIGEKLLEPMARWPDEQEKARQIWSRALSGETFNIVMEFGPSKADERAYDLRFNPLRDEQGRQIGAAHIFRDVTEQKRTEKARREREKHQRFLLRLSDALRAEADAEAVAERAIRMLLEHLQLDRCYVAAYRLSDDRADIRHQVGNADIAPLPDVVRLSDFPEVLKAVSEQTLVIEDASTTGELSDADTRSLDSLGLRAFIAATLRRGKSSPIWAIVAASARARHWTRDEIALVEEVTERTWTVIERVRSEATRRESEMRFRAFVSSTSDVLYRMSADWSEMRELGGRGFLADTDESSRDWMERYIPPEEQAKVMAAVREAIETASPFALEHRVRQADGKTGWVRSRAVPIFDDKEHLREWFGAASDVTSSKRAEEHQNMLMAELDHRVKNILALVQSIARQSLGRGQEVGPDAADRFVGRINALAKSHTLLATSRWEGARLADLVDSAVAPFCGERPDCVVANGPDIKVTPKAAQSLTLALHEIATNAAKYGALSRDKGSVSAKWRVAGDKDDERLVFVWEERGGPRIEAAPSRKGFGSRLIELTLAYELGGEVKQEFERSGLRVMIELPLAGVRARGGPRSSSLHGADTRIVGDPAMLRGKSVLVVEDEYLVGQEIAEVLRAAGCSITGPAGNVQDALRIAVSNELDAAVLDINLNGELVWPVARALTARRIPFVFTTGYSESIQAPSDLGDTLRIEKPVQPDRLVPTLTGVMTGAADPSSA